MSKEYFRTPVGLTTAQYLNQTVARVTDPEERYEMMRGRMDELRREAVANDLRGDVQAANTFSSALTTQFLIDGAVTKLQNRWAALKCFTRDFSTDPYKPLATGELKFVTTGSTGQVNATNFGTGDSVTTAVPITVNQYTQGFHVTNAELNSGARLEDLLEINMAGFADQIIGVVGAIITSANFPIPAITSLSSSFGWSNMQTAWGLLKKSHIHNAMLDGEYLAQIINVPNQFQKSGASPSDTGAWAAFGWDNIAINTNWTTADANTRGFICGPTALGCLSGLPLTTPFAKSHGLNMETILLPGLNISIAFHHWFSLATRTMWASYDIMFGASLLDATAGILVKSA
jgi:hypothetical protein